MATLSLKELKPMARASTEVVPAALIKALTHIFSNCGPGVWLVGGTALAGYYAKHRRSDDIDLFVRDETALQTVFLAIKSLQKIGASLSGEAHTPQYYKTSAEFKNHRFTIDVVVDENLHRIGNAVTGEDGVCVADLFTLFAQKIACLVSRCSEKDLFDLCWLFENIGEPDIANLIQMGAGIDSGLNTETLLISLKSTMLRKEACHFLVPHSKMTIEQAYRDILTLQKRLIAALLDYERRQPLSPDERALRETVRYIKSHKGTHK